MTKQTRKKVLTIGVILIISLSAIAMVIPDENTSRGIIWFPHIRAHTWALLNILLIGTGGFLTFVAALSKLVRMNLRKKEDLEVYKSFETNSLLRDRCVGYLIAMLITSFAGVLMYILTQDMTKQMIIADRWTIVHAIILGAQLTAVVIDLKRKSCQGCQSCQSSTSN